MCRWLEGSFARALGVVGLSLTLGSACGRTGLLVAADELDQGGSAGLAAAGGASGAVGGAGGHGGAGATGGVGGASGAGPSGGVGGVAGGTTGGSAGTGGDTTVGGGPDFDFTLEPDQAVAYQIDPARSGAQLARTIAPPLRQIWRRHYDAGVSYPIMADARVFVSVNATVANSGPLVEGHDAASGALLWTSAPLADGSTYTNAHLAYDRGRLFAVTRGGLIVAFDPPTGAVLWSASLTGRTVLDTPLAAGGAVFVTVSAAGTNGFVVLDGSDGRVLYERDLTNEGGATLGGGQLFVSGGCHSAVAANPSNGEVSWTHPNECFSGLELPGLFHGDRLWLTSDTATIALDAGSGTAAGRDLPTHTTWPLSAAGDELYSLGYWPGLGFAAWDTSTGEAWEIAVPSIPALPMLVTPGYAYVLTGDGGSGEYLHALDLGARDFVWQSPEPIAPPPDYWSPDATQPLQAMAASEGHLVVASGRWLAGYVSDADTVSPSVCGNYVLEGNEACDDGNLADGDYCNATCTAVIGSCGDGVVQGNESCDGGTDCNDGCQHTFPGVMLAAGRHHTCGLRADGSLRCWGSEYGYANAPADPLSYLDARESGSAGILADGNGTAVFFGAVSAEAETVSGLAQITLGSSSYCAVLIDGALRCWNVDQNLPDLPGPFASVAAWGDTYCALGAGGGVSCLGSRWWIPWGGSYRALARGSAVCAVRLDGTLACDHDVVPPPGQFTAITAGDAFACGIRSNGEVTCFSLSGAALPSELAAPAGKFALIDAGSEHVCGVRTDGVTVCWGKNDDGQATPPGDFP